MKNNNDMSISREEIEKRAYEIYLQRGAGHGLDEEDWLRAEAQLLEERVCGCEPSDALKSEEERA